MHRHVCPHCSILLRIRDRTFVGKRVDCPECREPIRIVADGPKGLAVLKEQQPPTNESPMRRTVSAVWRSVVLGWRRNSGSNAEVGKTVRADDNAGALRAGTAAENFRARTQWRASLTTPRAIAWTIAGSVAILLLLVVAWPRSRSGIEQIAENDAEQHATTAAVQGNTSETAHSTDEAQSVDRTETAEGSAVARDKLESLAVWIDDYLRQKGYFPPGTVATSGLPPEKQFSWLALIESWRGNSDAPEPLWDRAWDDPINARFVRRRIPEYLNPALPKVAASSRYPATHFVGVAGVGQDAPHLSATHPRAGIFGYERQTKASAIRDGRANTMLVAGAQEKLGSWAAGGRASIRPLTSEPYVNGPDGIGTGQADRMLVLMADGSVRTFGAQIDPRVFRRMAAMADGLDLALQLPGEPGAPVRGRRSDLSAGVDDVKVTKTSAPRAGASTDKRQSVTTNSELPVQTSAADDTKLLAEANGTPPVVAPRPKRLAVSPPDVAAALELPIIRFEHARPVPAQSVLRELQEMTGVPIRIDADAVADRERLLQQGVTLELEHGTLGDLLAQLAEELSLVYEVEAEIIRLKPAEPAGQ